MNLAAMLDMAFQLLMFFILTFSPTQMESQIFAQLPATGAVTQNMVAPPLAAGEITLTIVASEAGSIQDVAVDDRIVRNLHELEQQLHRQVAGRGPYSLILQVDSRLQYQELVTVVDTCIKTEGLTDQTIDKMTFVELRQRR